MRKFEEKSLRREEREGIEPRQNRGEIHVYGGGGEGGVLEVDGGEGEEAQKKWRYYICL